MPASPKKPKVLLIAGLDPTGQAGLLKDAAICDQLACEGLSLPTAFTLQDQKKYYGHHSPTALSIRQFFKVYSSQKIKAVKIGMLNNLTVTREIIRGLKKLKKQNPKLKIVWDPVLQSSSGGRLITAQAYRLSLKELMPLVHLVTPNFPEILEMLTQSPHDSSPKELCQHFVQTFKTPVYLKGGHTKALSKDFYWDGHSWKVIQKPSLKHSRRGTGCVFSAAVASHLSHNTGLLTSCVQAKQTVHDYIKYVSI